MKKMSKILSWLLVVCLLAAMFPTISAAEEAVVSAYYGIGEGMIGQIQPGTEESTLLSRLQASASYFCQILSLFCSHFVYISNFSLC